MLLETYERKITCIIIERRMIIELLKQIYLKYTKNLRILHNNSLTDKSMKTCISKNNNNQVPAKNLLWRECDQITRQCCSIFGSDPTPTSPCNSLPGMPSIFFPLSLWEGGFYHCYGKREFKFGKATWMILARYI